MDQSFYQVKLQSPQKNDISLNGLGSPTEVFCFIGLEKKHVLQVWGNWSSCQKHLLVCSVSWGYKAWGYMFFSQIVFVVMSDIFFIVINFFFFQYWSCSKNPHLLLFFTFIAKANRNDIVIAITITSLCHSLHNFDICVIFCNSLQITRNRPAGLRTSSIEM